MSITLTDQDKKILDLIAKGEAVKGNDPYTSLWPSTTEPAIIQMSLAEIDRFQSQRINDGFASSAIGRYQFIQKTLREAVGLLGVNPLEVRYTPDVQDALIIEILKTYRKYSEWLSGSYPTDKFMIKLSQEFASMPVPYRLKGHFRYVNKGESYYSGDSLNKASHGPDTLFQELEDIKNGEPGDTRLVDVSPTGNNKVYPVEGQTPKNRTATRAAGIGVGSYSGGNAGARPVPDSTLPSSSNVYNYAKIKPLDDRYDFRTGRTVKDILTHGTQPASDTPVISSNIGPANVAVTNSGAQPPNTSSTDIQNIFKESSVLSIVQSELFNSKLLNSILTDGEEQDSGILIMKPKRSTSTSENKQEVERVNVAPLDILNRQTLNKDFPKAN